MKQKLLLLLAALVIASLVGCAHATMSVSGDNREGASPGSSNPTPFGK